MKKTIVILGGHITPALAVISEIQKSYPEWKILFIGREYAFEGIKVLSEEYKLIRELKIPFFPLITGRLRRTIDILTLLSLFKIPIGLIQSIYFLCKYRPNVIISFGGYIALPVCVIGYCLHIPILTHEQTTIPGLANKIIDRLAVIICVSFPHMIKAFKASKVIYTGLPLRKELFIQSRTTKMSMPLLYITGGVTGAKTLNELVDPILPTLCRTYKVVHQVGSLWEKTYKKRKMQLQEDIRENYIVKSYCGISEHSVYMQQTHILISRSGANTVLEAAVLGKVCVFVPLPWSRDNEQEKNAKWLEDEGSAIVVNQKNSSSEFLMRQIYYCESMYTTMDASAQKTSQRIPLNASSRIVNLLATIVS